MEKVPVIDLVFFAAGFELLLLPYDPAVRLLVGQLAGVLASL